MEKNTTYNDLFPLQKALHRLCDSGVRFGFADAVRLSMVMNEVDSQIDLVLGQLVEAVPGLKDVGYEMTDEEKEVYTAILSTRTAVDDMGIRIGSLQASVSDAAAVDMWTVNTLLSFFAL